MTQKIRLFLLFGYLVSGCAMFEPVHEGSTTKIRDDNRLVVKEDSGPRKRVMVLPFLDSSDVRGQSLRDEARDEFINELNRTKALIAVDSNGLKVDFTKSIKGKEYDLESISKKAHELGAHSVLEGKLLDIRIKRMSDPVGIFRQVKTRFEAEARIRIYAARSGKEIFNTVKTVTLEEANVRVAEKVDMDRFLTNNPELMVNLVKQVFLDFTPQIVGALAKMSWEGRIAMVNGDRIFLNVGQVSGLQIGDILKVAEDGDEIYDPQSGNYIGKTPGRMKGTLEVVSFFGTDGAITVIHSGAGFKENDRVELY